MRIWRYFIDEHLLNEVFASVPLWGLLLTIAFTIYLLSRGADWMIDGSASLAAHTGLPKIVIGATILSLGTTAPEAFVSVMAAYMGDPGLALGNGVGSIIADTGLIFGITVLVATPSVNKKMLNRTGWWQIGSAVFLVILAGIAVVLKPEQPIISRPMGIILLILLAVYMIMAYKWAKNEMGTAQNDPGISSLSLIVLISIVGGLLLVIIASRLLIPAASETARRLGVPEDVIATTMVAFGTSLPELTTAIAAIRKGHPEMTVGNIVGADILNVLFVIGSASMAVPLAISPTFFRFHFPAMLLILLSFRFFISTNKKGHFQRWQGGWLVLLYVLYIVIQYAMIAHH